MIGDGGFKAHDARHGPKLGASLASGPTGLQRRLEAARERERSEELARRLRAGEAVALASLEVPGGPVERSAAARGGLRERSGAEQGTGENVGGVKPVLRPSTGKRGGRPREVEGEPWKAAGVSRRTWERRRKAGGKGDGS